MQTAGFFDSLNLPKLDESARLELDSNFSESKLIEAIQMFPSSKVPGPDGFDTKTLTPLLLRMINNSIKNNRLPKSLYEANICILFKKKTKTKKR